MPPTSPAHRLHSSSRPRTTRFETRAKPTRKNSSRPATWFRFAGTSARYTGFRDAGQTSPRPRGVTRRGPVSQLPPRPIAEGHRHGRHLRALSKPLTLGKGRNIVDARHAQRRPRRCCARFLGAGRETAEGVHERFEQEPHAGPSDIYQKAYFSPSWSWRMLPRVPVIRPKPPEETLVSGLPQFG